MKKFRFRDQTEYQSLQDTKVLKDQLFQAQQMGQGGGQSLFVRVAATHAGIITRNNGLYLPDKMRASEESWTKNYQKPVDIHHSPDTDPIGRVIRARYTDISDKIAADWVGKAGPDFKRMVDGKLSYLATVNYVADKLAGILEDEDYSGAGYMELLLKISDPESIQKVLDGRYLTGSTVQTTNAAICSICKEDWSTGKDSCTHKPGKRYEGKPCFLVAGDLEGEAYSFVKSPADPHSGVIEIIENGQITDSYKITEDEVKRPKTDSVYELSDSAEDAVSIKGEPDKAMVVSAHNGLHWDFDSQIEYTEKEVKIPKEMVDLHLRLHQEGKAGKFLSLFKIGHLDDTLEDKTLIPPVVIVPGKGAKTHMDKKEFTDLLEQLDKETVDFAVAADAAKTKFTEFSAQLKDSKVKAEDFKAVLVDNNFAVTEEQMRAIIEKMAALEAIESLWTFAMDSEWESYSEDNDPELQTYLKEHPEDAKLSTKERKKLPASTFCGPSKSFPVPDCSHVTAARRLIGKAKASPATKSRILACVSRKARALGCGGGSSKDSVAEGQETGEAQVKPVELTMETVVAWLKPLDFEVISHELLKAKEDKLTELETKLADEACSECKENLETADTLKVQVDELTKQVEALRTELQVTFKELEALTSAHIDTEDSLRQEKANRIADMELLKAGEYEGKVKREERVKMLLDQDMSTLGKTLDVLSQTVDITKIADKLNNSLTREVTDKTVQNPTLQVDNSTVRTEKTLLDTESLHDIEEQYLTLQFSKGPRVAKMYLDSLVAQGILPQSQISKIQKI